MVKWITHIAWGALTYCVLFGPLNFDVLGRIAVATIVGDMLTHSRGHRLWFHNYVVIIVHALVFYNSVVAGVVLGVVHVVLDRVSKGWFTAASFLFLILAAIAHYVLCTLRL